jgi:hypothetical protein
VVAIIKSGQCRTRPTPSFEYGARKPSDSRLRDERRERQ